MKRLVLATVAVAAALGMGSIASADHGHDRFSGYSKHGYGGYGHDPHCDYGAYGGHGGYGSNYGDPRFSSYGSYGASPYASYGRGYTVPRNPWPVPPPYGHTVSRPTFGLPPFPAPVPACATPRTSLSFWFGF